jgi:methyl-accepting chemotaxis protein
MVSLWRKMIVPHSEDEELNRRTFNLNVVLFVTFVVILLGIIAMLLQVGQRPLSYMLPNTALLVVAAGILVVCYTLARRGHVQAGSIIFVVLMTGACAGAIVTGGVRGALPVILVIPIATAGITLGSRVSIGLTLFNVGVLVVVGLLENSGVLQIAYAEPALTVMLNMFDVGFGLFFVSLSIWLYGHSLGQSLQRTREAVKEAQRYAAVEQERRAHLQTIIQQYVEYMAQVATGNLSIRLNLGPDNGPEGAPLLLLGRRLNDTTTSLQRMTAQLRKTATDLFAATGQILASTAQQATGAHEQSAAIAQATTTIDQVRSIAEQTNQRAQGVAELARRTAEISRAGQSAVTDSVAGIGQLKQQVEGIATTNLALSEQAQAIGQIIATVSEIANQSNMLALNAAVEAARAGQAGRGFAVVAGEVRNLAEQSRAATGQVKDILSEIQRGVNAAVMATEMGMKGTDASVQLVSDAGEAIRRLADSVAESAQAASQITAAAAQQLAGMEQIATAMREIHHATAQTAATTQQSEQTAEELNALAGQLQELVAQYQL